MKKNKISSSDLSPQEVKKYLSEVDFDEERKKLNYELNIERERKNACDIVENWIKSISKEFCSVNFNHNMNEVKINFEELPRAGFVDHGSLYDSLCACEEEMSNYHNRPLPKTGTVFVYGATTYVITSIETTDEGIKYIWVKSAGWKNADSWGSLKDYYRQIKMGNINIIYEP